MYFRTHSSIFGIQEVGNVSEILYDHHPIYVASIDTDTHRLKGKENQENIDCVRP